jgi:hypothetical protein
LSHRFELGNNMHLESGVTLHFCQTLSPSERVWHKMIKELNPRRVYVEIPKPSRVELKCSQNQRH